MTDILHAGSVLAVNVNLGGITFTCVLIKKTLFFLPTMTLCAK